MGSRWEFSKNRRTVNRRFCFSCFSVGLAENMIRKDRFPLNFPPPREEESSLIFHISIFLAMFRTCIDPKTFSPSVLAFTWFQKWNVLQFHPPRNSSHNDERISPFFALRVVMTIRKKVRRYRINVHSTPRWSSRYNQVVPSATLAQWKIQSTFSSLSKKNQFGKEKFLLSLDNSAIKARN